MNSDLIIKKFKELFNSNPLMIRSPGRINLIGEHTDYNDGFVFPAAIDKEIYFAMARNSLMKFRFHAIDLKESFEIKVADLKISNTPWANYLLGVAAQYQKEGHKLEGVDCVFGGDIPIGAGLSSSAAIENGFAFGLNELLSLHVSKMEMIKISQMAEHEYAGVMCGIMDQFASISGKKDYALKLDCRSLDFEYINIDLKEYCILLCNTNVKHNLAATEYNKRREECNAGVKILQKHNKNIKALRDVSLEFLKQHRAEFDTNVYKRCAYVIKENLRVEEAFSALGKNDINKLGALMYKSHEGLRDDYEVSCKELDQLFNIAKHSEDVIGARMMGGGFGGCTINIVKKDKVNSFKKVVIEQYYKVNNIEPEIYSVKITEGTGLI